MRPTYTSSCKHCLWTGPLRLHEDQARSDAVWHVYEQHRAEWVGLVGARPPKDFDARAVN